MEDRLKLDLREEALFKALLAVEAAEAAKAIREWIGLLAGGDREYWPTEDDLEFPVLDLLALLTAILFGELLRCKKGLFWTVGPVVFEEVSPLGYSSG